ncbi:hypothetical protein Tco_1068152 [Tanacetum coccineum]|uniref:Uncharacterized protein n=1 Tax=Tanacetum coccineum TaxID=301880 RepID=A0ABQ5HEW9_9ASTR
MEQPQQIISADQLVTTKYQSIGRCNNYAVIQNIPCSKDCKIVVRLVVNANETIRFTMDRKEITYTVDMFCLTLKLPVETPENPFIAPTTLKFIQPFLKTIGYQGNVDKIFHAVVNRVHVDYVGLLWWDFLHYVQQKKDAIQYPRFTKLIIYDLIKKFDSIPQRLEEYYHSIKDDIPLVSVYTTGNVTIKGILIPNEFITEDIRATPEYEEYGRCLPGTPTPVVVVDDVVQKKKRTQVAGETSSLRKSLISLALHKTDKIAEEQENMAAVEEHLLKEDVEKIVEGDDEESYVSAFVDSVFLNEEEDIDDKKDDDNDDDDNDDHTDHTLVKTQVTGSLENRNEKMQTPIPSPLRSPRTDLSSDKTISKELTANVSPTPATTSQDPSKSKCISSKYKHIPGALHMICRRQGLIKQMEKKFIASNATNDIIEDNLTRVIADTIIKERDTFLAFVPALIFKKFADHAPTIIEELFKNHINKNVITVHPIISSSIATTTTDLQHQLYLKLKSNLQNQVDDPELWDVLKHHDDHQEDDAPPEGEKRAKRKKTSKGLKSTSGSSSKQQAQRSNTYNKKVNYRESKLLNALMTFIRSRVIWKRVHDFQLGIKSYQIRINLTALTLIFPVEIVKFCDATLERVLNKVKLKIFETEFLKKAHLLGELDLDIMKAYKREITKRLRHRNQMRR